MDNEDLLYGFGSEENIVAVEPVYKKNLVQVFKRINGTLESYYEKYNYLVYANDTDPIVDKYKTVKKTKLFGSNFFNVLLETEDHDIYKDLKYNRKYQTKHPFSRTQWFLQTGNTSFKGMEQKDLLVLYFDIEVLTTKGFDFPNPDREGDEVMIISMRTNNGDEYVLHTDVNLDKKGRVYHAYSSEESLLNGFLDLFREINPDVIANHNIFGFDLPYLEKRFDMYGIDFALGRNGSEPVTFDTTIKFADRSRKFTNYNIYGRHVIDTQFLAEYTDVTNRDMPSYRLKDLVKYLDKASDDRVYIDGDQISKVWNKEHPKYTREDLIDYALDDVREAEILYNEYGEVFFVLSQMVPMPYQDVFRYGTGNEVEYIFMREYLRQDWSYPRNTEEGKVPGGYADVLNFDIYKEKMLYIDVMSLYPSLADKLGIQPKKDELKLFPKILYLLFDIKKSVNKEEDPSLYALTKIFLNTMSYGFIASPWNSFSDYEEASKITLGGQEQAKKIIEVVEQGGGTIIRWDTDGGVAIPPEQWKDDLDGYCDHLTEQVMEGIIVENDGEFAGIIPFDGKSYALLELDGTIKKKGASIISRRIEKFGRDYLAQAVKYIFDNDVEEAKIKCHELYNQTRERIENLQLEPEEVANRANLGMSPEEYKNRNAAGETPSAAQYELACNSDKEYDKGDVVLYYIKEFPYIVKEVYGKPQLRKKKCANYEAGEFIDNYNYDYEVDHYLGRLDAIIKVFMVFGEDFFYDIFPNVKCYSDDRRKFEERIGRPWKTRNL